MSPKEHFKSNLRHLRSKDRFTQQGIAKELGVDRRRYCAWEYGIARPDFDMLVKICEFFDVGIDNFLTVDLTKQ